MVSRLERGLLAGMTWSAIERISSTLGIRLDLVAHWRGAEGAVLLDRVHAAIVELVVRDLSRWGWTTLVEYGFNDYGDRGSVDVLAWHGPTRTLLIIEVKSAIVDIQGLIGSMLRKARVVPRLIAVERGWQAVGIGRLIVVAGTTASRAAIGRHQATFDVTFPQRTPTARRWLRRPSGSLAAIAFVSNARVASVMDGRRPRLRAGPPGANVARPHASRPDA